LLKGNLRIGVYLCGCEGNIGRVVGLDEVLRLVEKLPEVVHAVKEDYLCSEEALQRLKSDIERPPFYIHLTLVFLFCLAF